MATNHPPRRKRKRAVSSSSSDETPQSADIRQSAVTTRSDMWYDDGNVILQAESIQFKVHKSILAENSSVFNDMFAFPQPPSMDAQLVEGCAVVLLSDSAEDMGYVLQELCQRKHRRYGVKLPFTILSAFLCLGQKYDIQDLYVDAKKMIFTGVPATLHDLDALLGLPTGPAAFKLHPSVPSYSGLYGIQLVILARRTGLLSILPFALYYSSIHCTPEQIMEGIVLDDETVLSLAVKDQLACFTGYRAMLDAQADTTYAWLHDDNFGANCIIPDRCQPSKQKHIINIFLRKQRAIGLKKWIDMGPWRLCVQCHKAAQIQHGVGRAELWEKLPGMFGLPPWTELVRERENL